MLIHRTREIGTRTDSGCISFLDQNHERVLPELYVPIAAGLKMVCNSQERTTPETQVIADNKFTQKTKVLTSYVAILSFFVQFAEMGAETKVQLVKRLPPFDFTELVVPLVYTV